MGNDPLTPVERSTLRRLLAKAEASGEDTSWSKTAVQARKARAEQERLAKEQERSAEERAARIKALGAALDRVRDEMSAIVERRVSASMFNRPPRSEVGFGSAEDARSADEYTLTYNATRAVNGLYDNFERKLAKFDAAGITPESLEWHFRAFLECDHPALFAPPPPAVDTAAIEAARLDEQRARTAKAIVDAGKLRRNEPVDAAGIINLASFRETKKDK